MQLNLGSGAADEALTLKPDGAGGTLVLPGADVESGTTFVVGTEAELNQAIADVDAATAPGAYTIQLNGNVTEGADTGDAITFEGQTLSAPADLYAFNLQSGVSVTLNGAGFALDGASKYRGLFAYAGDLTVENLTIQNAGGHRRVGRRRWRRRRRAGRRVCSWRGRPPTSSGANVTLTDVNFANDGAQGGAGGAGGSYGGGGGLGGNASGVRTCGGGVGAGASGDMGHPASSSACRRVKTGRSAGQASARDGGGGVGGGALGAGGYGGGGGGSGGINSTGGFGGGGSAYANGGFGGGGWRGSGNTRFRRRRRAGPAAAAAASPRAATSSSGRAALSTIDDSRPLLAPMRRRGALTGGAGGGAGATEGAAEGSFLFLQGGQTVPLLRSAISARSSTARSPIRRDRAGTGPGGLRSLVAGGLYQPTDRGSRRDQQFQRRHRDRARRVSLAGRRAGAAGSGAITFGPAAAEMVQFTDSTPHRRRGSTISATATPSPS